MRKDGESQIANRKSRIADPQTRHPPSAISILHSPFSIHYALFVMVAVLLVAATLRWAACGQVPPGLYHDEAYNGLDALEVLRGRLSLYFPANNGREPLFIYLVTLAVGLLGRSPFALRLPASFVGLLTVAATAAAGRALFSRRVGVLGAAVLAVTLWHVHLSRVSFRAVLLPLFIALTVWQAVLGASKIRTPQFPIPNPHSALRNPAGWRHWLAAGVFYGLSFYTYSAARFTPVALIAFAFYMLLVRPPTSNLQSAIRNPQSAIRNPQSAIRTPHLWRGIGLAAMATLVVLAPLAIYTVGHLGVVLGRPDQVSVFNPAINGGDLWGTLGRHTLRTLGMFFVRGDRIWRHNVPWRPIFDPLLGGAFVVGLLVALRRARRDAAAGFVLVWVAVMSLPTLLAEDAPHFLRAAGILPIVAFLPALGLDWLADTVESQIANRKSAIRIPHFQVVHWSQRTRQHSLILHSLILILPLLFGLASTAWAYFGDYARDPMTGYWFERGAVMLGSRANEFLGLGWDGNRMLHGSPGDRRVYLDPTLWDKWPQVRLLIAAPQAVTVGLKAEPTSNLQLPTPQSALPSRKVPHRNFREGSAISNPQVAVFLWPYDDWRRAWPLLPVPAEITVEEGPLSQGDRDLQPYTTYLAFFAARPDAEVPALARFSDPALLAAGGVELLDATVTPAGPDRLRVRLDWRASALLAEDYTVFLHYLRDGERIAQADSRPAGGRYPTTVWHAGDVVHDDHYVEGVGSPLPGRDVLLFGLWQPESGASLYRLDEAGNPAGDWIEVPVDGN